MKKRISKSQILDACINKQEELVNSFEHRVNLTKADAFEQEHSASQTEDRKAGKVELLRTFEKELGFVRMEMNYLKTISASKTSTIVEPGAVVVTDKMTFFIAVSSEKIEVDGEIIFGMSTKAPLFIAMQGLKKGDIFEFNGTEYHIEGIY